MNKATAIQQANKIRQFWAGRGVGVKVEIVSIGNHDGHPAFALRSDTRNGLPLSRKISSKAKAALARI